jgi:sialate O-acetylesterase
VPVGVIEAAWGATLAENWMSKAALRRFPEFTVPLAAVDEKARFYWETLLPQKHSWYEQHGFEDRGREAGQDVWANPGLDTASWPTIELPRPETAMGSDFNGFGGVIWWNGVPVGQTKGDGISRLYVVPGSQVRAGPNNITVRLTGASVFGDSGIGLFGPADAMKAETCSKTVPLSGTWSYQPGPDLRDFPVADQGLRVSYPPLTALFNGMINPLSAFRIKGVIWYQGEANAIERRAVQYRHLFPALIEDWRHQWGYELPFLFVRLAGLGDMERPDSPWFGQWVELREAQSMALSLPRTGMCTAVDIGDANDIHPLNKQDVAHRLALAAAKVAYGENIVYAGPTYRSMQIEGDRIRIKFTNLGSGLLIKDKYGYVRGFEIAGVDGQFHWAHARQEGQDILVFNEPVQYPAAVRYDWSNLPDGNVYNQDGLPAVPFRTDEPNPIAQDSVESGRDGGIAWHTVNIVFIGDSITAGAGLAAPDSQAPPVVSVEWLRKHEPGMSVFFSNEGKSGHTTVDALPVTRSDFPAIEQAAAQLQGRHGGRLIFSIMLGTNDSAMDGPLGSPVSPEDYRKNLASIIERLLEDYPRCTIILNRPIWYSPNTYNASRYLAEGLRRLQSYFPAIDALVAQYHRTHPHQVLRGDTQAYNYFRQNYHADLIPEDGQQGTFYLHPNPQGAEMLGHFWGAAIQAAIR